MVNLDLVLNLFHTICVLAVKFIDHFDDLAIIKLKCDVMLEVIWSSTTVVDLQFSFFPMSKTMGKG